MARKTLGHVLSLKSTAVVLASLVLPSNAITSLMGKPSTYSGESSSLAQIDHEFRVRHAEELMGVRGAKKARVNSALVAAEMDTFIREYVNRSLPPVFKQQTEIVTNSIVLEARRHGLDPLFVMAVISHESGFNPTIMGRFGEIGLMQIKPSTAQWIAHRMKIKWTGPQSLLDPATNIRLSTAYMAWLRKRFALRAGDYISAYNMGPSNVRKLAAVDISPKLYAGFVMGKYTRYYARLGARAERARTFSITMTSEGDQVFGRISN